MNIAEYKAAVQRFHDECEKSIGRLPGHDLARILNDYHERVVECKYALPHHVRPSVARAARFSSQCIGLQCLAIAVILLLFSFAFPDWVSSLTWALGVMIVFLELSRMRESGKLAVARTLENVEWLDEHGDSRTKLLAMELVAKIAPDAREIIEDIAAHAFNNKQELLEGLSFMLGLLASHPVDSRTWEMVGLMLQDMGKLALAEEALATASRFNKDEPDYRHNHAVILSRIGRLDEAIKEEQGVLAMQPTHGFARNALWFMLFKAGRLEESVQVMVDGIMLDTREPYYQFHLAVSWMTPPIKDMNQAKQHLDAALSLNPKIASADYFQGIYHLANGDKEKARDYLSRAFLLDPSLSRDDLIEILPFDGEGNAWLQGILANQAGTDQTGTGLLKVKDKGLQEHAGATAGEKKANDGVGTL